MNPHTVDARGMPTLFGLSAVLMWSLLGVLTEFSGDVPPFLLTAMCFAVSGVGGLLFIVARGDFRRAIPRSLPAFALGVAGLFGYHFLYFTALRNAPAVAANLLNYLWPLLIVLLAGLLPQEHLRRHHVLGAGIGFAGAALIVLGGENGVALDPAHVFGYLAAFGAALVWSSYSVLSRQFVTIASQTLVFVCLAAAGLSFLCHRAFETTVLPATGVEWLAIGLLGALPVGGAFFVWDVGMKHGHIQVLGAAAYGAPILSTILLIVSGVGTFTTNVLLACILVTAGGLMSAKDLVFKPRP